MLETWILDIYDRMNEKERYGFKAYVNGIRDALRTMKVSESTANGILNDVAETFLRRQGVIEINRRAM